MFYDIIHQLPLQKLVKRGKQYNFKCPVCNDGTRGKTRAWFFRKNSKWIFYCFNCSTGHSFRNFIKYYYPEIYKNFIKLSFKKGKKEISKEVEQKLEESIKTYKKFPLISVDMLGENHKAYQYIQKRKIPVKSYNLLYYSHDFTEFTNKMTNNRYDHWKFHDERLVIPFKKRNGEIVAFQGREIEEDGFLRYATVKIDVDFPKVYGLERVDYTKKVVVVEGPIDSLFVDNCIAFGGSDLSFENLERFFDKSQLIMCFDNEKRNLEINNKIEKFIKKGYSVCLWPNGLKKDINDMVLKNNLTVDEINSIIHKNVVSGKLGLLKFKQWRKR